MLEIRIELVKVIVPGGEIQGRLINAYLTPTLTDDAINETLPVHKNHQQSNDTNRN
ncbi:hypothetical protein LCGC14_2490710 [marine sediment metagenome]|uniref:Uncharacterized protein n=1 Tax=marine sediment metagenome TaxID=412755 RepID=A0A0F9B4W8_9ZZZZ